MATDDARELHPVTSVELRLEPEGSGHGVLAYATVELHGLWVVRDVRVVSGPRGLIVQMPSRKVTDRCANPECNAPNPLRSRYCGACGSRLPEGRRPPADASRPHVRDPFHEDVFHPRGVYARGLMTEAVLGEYRRARDARSHPSRPRAKVTHPGGRMG